MRDFPVELQGTAWPMPSVRHPRAEPVTVTWTSTTVRPYGCHDNGEDLAVYLLLLFLVLPFSAKLLYYAGTNFFVYFGTI